MTNSILKSGTWRLLRLQCGHARLAARLASAGLVEKLVCILATKQLSTNVINFSFDVCDAVGAEHGSQDAQKCLHGDSLVEAKVLSERANNIKAAWQFRYFNESIKLVPG